MYDYKIRASRALCEEFAPQLGGQMTMIFMPGNRIISQCQINISPKILLMFKFIIMKIFVTPFLSGWVVFFLIMVILNDAKCRLNTVKFRK